MRAIPSNLPGFIQTGDPPQSILQILSDARVIVLAAGTVVFLLALLILIIRRRRRLGKKSRAPTTGTSDASAERVSVQMVDLEGLIEMGTELYRALGHSVRDVTNPSKDVADLIIDAQNGERWIVRCLAKPTINSQEVAAFRKAIHKAKIPESALITNGSFTPQALEEAERGPIHTLDLLQLHEYILQAKQVPAE